MRQPSPSHKKRLPLSKKNRRALYDSCRSEGICYGMWELYKPLLELCKETGQERPKFIKLQKYGFCIPASIYKLDSLFYDYIIPTGRY